MNIHERYLNDPRFHTLVDVLLSHIIDGNFTPTEIREAAMVAQIKFEEIYPRKIVFNKADIMSGKV